MPAHCRSVGEGSANDDGEVDGIRWMDWRYPLPIPFRETRRRQPSLTVIEVLGRYLGLSLAEFMAEVGRRYRARPDSDGQRGSDV